MEHLKAPTSPTSPLGLQCSGESLVTEVIGNFRMWEVIGNFRMLEVIQGQCAFGQVSMPKLIVEQKEILLEYRPTLA